MKYRVRVLRRAEPDLTEIERYVHRDSPEAAVGVVDGLLDSLESLHESPLRGVVPGDERLKRLGFRFLAVAPHLVFYKVVRKEVRVYRILHGKRAYEDLL